MKSAILTISTAAFLLSGAVAVQARAAVPQWYPQWDRRPYANDQRREEFGERRAFEIGEREGYSKGLNDARHHRYPDLYRQKWYRNGDHNYNRNYGPRDEYRMEYRRGFEQGYDRAYREGWNGRRDWDDGWRR